MRAHVLYGAKYPFTSSNKSAACVWYAVMEPVGEAGTIAAFDTTLPSNEFRFEPPGCTPPCAHIVR